MDRAGYAYDELPYRSYPYPLSSPEHLSALAYALGHDAALPSACKVLEIGCASGFNLIPAAMRNPASQFTGVDLSTVQIATAQQTASRLGLRNIEFVPTDVRAIDGRDRSFDFIICHGVYSWVSPETQAAILALCRRCLSPAGVAYISYNCYPGWKTREIIRDAMRFRVANTPTADNPVALARGIVDYLAEVAPPGTGLGTTINAERKFIAEADPEYVSHEFLAEFNSPQYLQQFVADARSNGLAYLVDSEIEVSGKEGYAARIVDPLLAETGGDPVLFEQYLDFATDRQFRRSLLIHAEQASGLPPRISARRLATMHFRSSPDSSIVETDKPTRRLVERWPATASYDEVVSWIAKETTPSLDSASEAVARLVYTGRALISRSKTEIASPLTGRVPQIALQWRKMARVTTEQGRSFLVSPHHEAMVLDPIETIILPLLDGQHSDADLLEALLRGVQQGLLRFFVSGEQVVQADRQRDLAANHLSAFKDRFTDRFSVFAV